MGVVGHEGGAVQTESGSLSYRRWGTGGANVYQQLTAPDAVLIGDGLTDAYGSDPILPPFPDADSTSAAGFPDLPSGYTYTGSGYYMVRLVLTRGTPTGGSYWLDTAPSGGSFIAVWAPTFEVRRLAANTSPLQHRVSNQLWHATEDTEDTHHLFDAENFPHPYNAWVDMNDWTSENDVGGYYIETGFSVPFGPITQSVFYTAPGAEFGMDYTWPLGYALSVQPFASINHPDDDIYPPPSEGASLYGLAMDLTPLGGIRIAHNQGFDSTTLRLRSSDDGGATFSDALLPFTGRSPDVLCLPDGRLWVFEETDGQVRGHASDDDGANWA